MLSWAAHGYKLTSVDVPTLRRIALLTARLSEDDPSLRPSMKAISAICDRMKSEVAGGQALPPAEVEELETLLAAVTVPRVPHSMIEAAVLDELRDLSRTLSAA